MPIRMIIDTETNDYSLQLQGILRASLMADEEAIIKVQLRNWLFTHELYPLRIKAVKKQGRSDQQKKKRPSSMKFKNTKIIMRLVKSFRVKRLKLNIDTGDVILNAKLYPVFELLHFLNADCQVNFMGKNALVLIIENRPIRLLKSFIKI